MNNGTRVFFLNYHLLKYAFNICGKRDRERENEREKKNERERTGQKYEGILLYTKMISRCSLKWIINNME